MAGPYFDLATATPILKELYDGVIVEDEVYEENPWLTMVPKKTNFGGKYYPFPVQYAANGGRSASFTIAQGNQAPAQFAEFLLTRKKDYEVATLDNETMMAASSDKESFVEAAKTVIDSAIRKITLSLASGLFRSGTGTLGQVSTTTAISTGIITLQDPNAVTQFEINDVLQYASTDGGTPIAALGYVIARDVIGGTITVSATGIGGAAGTPTSWTTSGYLLAYGDSNAKISGLQAWLTVSAPSTSDNFYGVNRSVDRWRLAGGYYDGSGYSISEALVQAANIAGREGEAPKMGITNFSTYAALTNELGGKVQYAKLSGEGELANIGFEGIKLIGPRGTMTIIPDRNCPSFTTFLASPSKWELKSLGEAPMILRYDDGDTMLRVTTADAAELRVGYYANLLCRRPSANVQVKTAQ
jgi:hypothetical protein